MRVRVRVPATSANLGPGFDTLGIALSLYNEVVLWPGPGTIRIVGEGVDRYPRDASNLVVRAANSLFARIGKPAPRLSVDQRNEIPTSGGLGSSAAALIGGLLGANALAGEPFSRIEVLNLASELEGHPDNVAAAVLGGLAVGAMEGNQVYAVRIEPPTSLRAVVYAPKLSLSTSAARRLLPHNIPRRDAVFNLGRTALFVAAMSTGKLELLRPATEDRLHQPYREKIFPQMQRFFAAAREAGALGACLSGAGSAVLALSSGREDEIAAALTAVGEEYGVSGRVYILDVDRQGAQVAIEE